MYFITVWFTRDVREEKLFLGSSFMDANIGYDVIKLRYIVRTCSCEMGCFFLLEHDKQIFSSPLLIHSRAHVSRGSFI